MKKYDTHENTLKNKLEEDKLNREKALEKARLDAIADAIKKGQEFMAEHRKMKQPDTISVTVPPSSTLDNFVSPFNDDANINFRKAMSQLNDVTRPSTSTNSSSFKVPMDYEFSFDTS